MKLDRRYWIVWWDGEDPGPVEWENESLHLFATKRLANTERDAMKHDSGDKRYSVKAVRVTTVEPSKGGG